MGYSSFIHLCLLENSLSKTMASPPAPSRTISCTVGNLATACGSFTYLCRLENSPFQAVRKGKLVVSFSSYCSYNESNRYRMRLLQLSFYLGDSLYETICKSKLNGSFSYRLLFSKREGGGHASTSCISTSRRRPFKNHM